MPKFKGLSLMTHISYKRDEEIHNINGEIVVFYQLKRTMRTVYRVSTLNIQSHTPTVVIVIKQQRNNRLLYIYYIMCNTHDFVGGYNFFYQRLCLD